MSLPPKIKGFSLNASSKSTKPPSSKRPHSSILDDGDSNDDAHVPVSTITEFDSHRKREKTPERVIEPAVNTDWITEYRRKRQKNVAARASAADDGAAATSNAGPEVMQSSVTGGLQIRAKSAKDDEPGTEAAGSVQEAAAASNGHHDQPDAEQQAISALLGEEVMLEQETIRPIDEDEAFQTGRENAANDPTLDDYERVPVHGFGAALLRGYLRPGETLDSLNKSGERKQVEKRPALLGLGAKEMKGVDMELGAWGKGAKDIQYNPLARKNTKTGEVVHETEFQAQLKEQAQNKSGKSRYNDRPDKLLLDSSHTNRKRRDDDNDDRRQRDRSRDRHKHRPYESRHRRDESDRRTDSDGHRERRAERDGYRERRTDRDAHRERRTDRDDYRERRRDRDDDRESHRSQKDRRDDRRRRDNKHKT